LALTDQEKAEWLAHAKANGYKVILIVKDFTDRSIFPIYVANKSAVSRMKKMFISESKMKILETIDVRSNEP